MFMIIKILLFMSIFFIIREVVIYYLSQDIKKKFFKK